jgi:hypothetical protein
MRIIPSIEFIPGKSNVGSALSVIGPDFTFSRTTTPVAGVATRVNASGLIETVPDNVLRLDYPVTGGCPAALIEPAGTNLAWHSQTWATGTNWFLTNTTTATGTTGTLDPLGTNTANAISPTEVNDSHFLASNNPTAVSYTSGTIYTQSAFFKQGTGAAGRYVQLTFPSARFTQLGYANFDLQTGVLVASGGTADANRAASIENYGNGWYRCRLTATCNSTGTGVGVIPVLITASGDTRAPSFKGVTGDVLYGWGAQLETGAVATSYIPTTTASATRAADVCSVSGVSGYIGQTEGTIYAEVDLKNFEQNARIIALSDGTTNNRITLIFNTASRFRLLANVSTSGQVDLSSSAQVSGIYKVAVAYKENDYAFYLNGTQIGTDTSALVPACTSVFLGKIESSASTNFLNDRIRAAAIYTTRLSNAQLIDMTWQ